MITLSAQLTFSIQQAQTFKVNRMVTRSLVDKTRHKFHVSIAEVATQNQHKVLTLGVAVVSGEMMPTRNMLDEIINFMDKHADAELISMEEY